jgi:hypothetical protein
MICRPRDLLVAFTQNYPRAWSLAGELIRDKGKDGLPDWPDWCFLPLAGSYAVVSAELGVSRIALPYIGDVARHAALCAWRLGQGIYRFDPAVFDAVRETPVAGDIPHDVLYRLPEWCIYIETPGMDAGGHPLHGAFVHLEHDANTGRAELRLLLDTDAELIPVPLHLGPWSLAESIQRMAAEADQQAAAHGLPGAGSGDAGNRSLVATVEPVVSLVLYVCSQSGDIGVPGHQPARAAAKRTKRGLQFFPADKPATWDVGVRLGAALRRAYQAEQTGSDGQHSGPRPHIRRAHWHGFRSGPRLRPDGSEIPAADRAFDLRWMPPIAVNVDENDLPAVVRKVGGAPSARS